MSRDQPGRDGAYHSLMDHARGLADDQVFACVYATWATGAGVLPDWLGLTPDAWGQLLARHFPGANPPPPVGSGRVVDLERNGELEDLERLLIEHRAGAGDSEIWMARIVTYSCLGMDHLWQDLGLFDRGQLTDLMNRNFPTLAGRNHRDMKWKKFLYKQLCQAEGIYLCRAPSCDVCTDYASCFGPED